MINNIRFARDASLRLVSRLRTTPSSELLPLFQGYFQRVVKRLKVTDSKTLVPLLTQYLGAACRERGALTIHRLREINNGWENDVYSFTANWGGFGHAFQEDLILRVYPGANAQTRAQNEYETLKMLYGVDYPVPRVDLFIGAEESPFCKPFLVMERVSGRGMCRDLFHSTPESCQQYLPVFCELLARLHALDWRAIVPNPEKYAPASADCDNGMTADEVQLFNEAQLMPGFIPAFNCLIGRKHDLTCPELAIVHLDFHPDNVLINDYVAPGKKEAYVIDWTSSTIADYRYDLAWTMLLTGSMDGWDTREQILHEYEFHAKRKVKDMEFFEAASCFARLISFIFSLRYGADAAGFRPGAEKMMRAQAPSIRVVYEHHLKLTGISIPEVEAFLDEVKA